MKPLMRCIPLLTAVVFAGCAKQPEQAQDEVRPVWTMQVGESLGSVGASYSGEIRARYESKLAFRTSGKVAERLVEVGSHVTAGQTLLRLDQLDAALNHAAALANADAATTRVAQARLDLNRSQQLFAQNFVSRAEVDRRQLDLNSALSQLRATQAQTSIARNQRGYATLNADRSGVVTAIEIEAGQVVSTGQAVVAVAADGEREVVISVPESRVEELRAANSMTISVWANPGKTYAGSLRELAPDTDDVSRTYAARITIHNSDAALRLGMTASVQVPDVAGGAAVRVPLTAVSNHTGAPMLWVVDPTSSKVTARKVRLGAAQNDFVIVADGVKQGESIVTAGVHMLHEGQSVKPVAAQLAQGE